MNPDRHQSPMRNNGHTQRRQEDPFFQRIQLIIDEWIESEWDRKESIRVEAQAHGWNEERKIRFQNATLSTETLPARVDGMSEAKFRRELKKINAPTPGELIRKARIRHAIKLLTHTRLLVKQIAERVGYASEKHFADAFRAKCGVTPSQYRRRFINNIDKGN